MEKRASPTAKDIEYTGRDKDQDCCFEGKKKKKTKKKETNPDIGIK